MVQALRFIAVALLAVSIGAAAQAAAPTCSVTANPTTVSGSGNVIISWSAANAVVCTASGAWSGTKDCAGGSTEVRVDTTRTFNLAARSSTGTMPLRWTKPLRNTDGTPTVITGYRLYVSSSPIPDNYDPASSYIYIHGGDTLSRVLDLTPGTYYARIKSIRDDGVVSAYYSNQVQYNVTAGAARCSATVTVTSAPNAPILSTG